MEQLESRALGKPKETLVSETEEVDGRMIAGAIHLGRSAR
jgi:hypothetical protein